MLSLRTLSVLTVTALSLAACGGPGDGPSSAATPQFVEPSSAAAPESVAPAESAEPPAAAGKVSVPATPKAPAKKKPAAAPLSVKYVFPVKASNVDYHPTHSKYPATDIFADCGEPVVATTSGVVLEVSYKDEYVKGRPDGPLNGGLSVSLLGDDGVRYYGSHLSKVQSGIKKGKRVKAGQLLGKVGRTGNANNVCHLHFALSPPCRGTGDWWVRRGVLYPWPYLDAWRKHQNKSAVAKVKAWKTAHNCRA